jgi:hypothetical protein
LLGISLLNRSIGLFVYPRVEMKVPSIEKATGGLQALAEVPKIFEEATFSSEMLCRLQDSLLTEQVMPSTAVRKLWRIVDFLSPRNSLVGKSFERLVFVTPHVVFATRRWQRAFGHAIRGWLAAVGEVEAVASLAGYGAEHPTDVQPEFAGEGPIFDAECLAHPLLPEEHAVGNDLKLNQNMQLIIISGPNMAGKSTFLRGVGLNAVLAQCGAPVRAKRLRLSPLAVGRFDLCTELAARGRLSVLRGDHAAEATFGYGKWTEPAAVPSR